MNTTFCKEKGVFSRGKVSSQKKTGLLLTFALQGQKPQPECRSAYFHRGQTFKCLGTTSICETEKKNIFLASIYAMFSSTDAKALEGRQLLSLRIIGFGWHSQPAEEPQNLSILLRSLPSTASLFPDHAERKNLHFQTFDFHVK